MPTAAKAGLSCGFNLFLECVKTAKRSVNSRPKNAFGRAAAVGESSFQKSEWLAWPPPLLRTAARISTGTRSSDAMSDSTARLSSSGFPGDGFVEVGDVGAVMLVMVDRHGERVNVRLKRLRAVRK